MKLTNNNNYLSAIRDLIKKVLPLGEEFNKLTLKEQCKVNNDVRNWFGTNNNFKTPQNLEKRSQYLGLSFNESDFRKFDVDFNALMTPGGDSPEKVEGLIYYFSSAVETVKLHLKECHKDLEFIENNITIARSISSKVVFACFLFHISRTAYTSFKKHKGDVQGICAKKVHAMYDIEHEVWCHIVCAVLRHGKIKHKSGKRKLSEKSINTFFQLQFRNSSVESLPYAQKDVALVTDIIFSLLEKNNFLSGHYNMYDPTKKRQFKFYILDPKVEILVALTGVIPDLVKPQKLTGEGVVVKNISCGASMFKPSKKLIDSVNIANRIPYMVDEEALSFFQQERQSLHPKTYKLPFPTVYEEREAKKLLKQVSGYRAVLPKGVKPVSVVRNVYHRGKKAVDEKKSTRIFCEQQVEINRQKLLAFEVGLILADCLIGYTLYYPIKFDYRGRQYPLAKFAANTSGNYRYLVKIKDKYTINTTGLEEVFKAIYSNTASEEKATEFLASGCCYKLSKKDLYKELLAFLNKNTPSEQCFRTNFIYKTLLINKFKSLRDAKFKTSIRVERDQKSSSSVFMAMLLRNRALASKSSLTGSSGDVVSFLQTRFRAFFACRIEEGETIFSLFEKDRRLLKGGLMFLIYGQKSFGRLEYFREYLKKEHGLVLNPESLVIIKKIAFDFESFVNANVENFGVQLEKLDRVIDFLVRANKKYSVTTLDGAHLSWVAFSKLGTKVINYYSPVKGAKRAFRQRLHTSDNRIDYIKTLRACKANVIQSIDGAIIREFTRRFNAAGYDILTIHDCVQYNPNAARVFEKIVLGIYQDPKILKAFFDSVFIPGRDNLQENLRIEFDILIDELYVDSKLKGLSILNYENLYELE